MSRPVGRFVHLEIAALAVSLVAILGLISVMLALKAAVTGVPRFLFIFLIAMACAPFCVSLWRVPRPLFLIPPVVAVFLLYPIGAPHGIVWGTDPVFNFSFSDSVVASGFWVPGRTGTFEPAYSYYPIGNVFIGYIIITAALPGAAAFLWIEPVLRMLAIPAAVYAIARRQFTARTATLGLFLYMGTASILFNVPVQQGMGVIFVALALLCLLMLPQSPNRADQRRVQILFGLAGIGIVMTHHMSSYFFAGWVAVLAVLMTRRRFRTNVLPHRWGLLSVCFIALLGLYIATFTYPIFLVHQRSAEVVIDRLISPELLSTGGPGGPPLGRTFSLIELAWIAGSVLGLLALSLFSLRLYLRARIIPVAVANGLIAVGLVVVTLPLLATGGHYVPLRVSEYANLFVAPFAAATLLRWSRSDLGRLPQFAPRRLRESTWAAPAVTLLLVVALFMGGTMVGSNTRLYFEDPGGRYTETPLLFGADAQRAGAWARTHLGEARFWGDQQALTVFAGFAQMRMEYGSSRLFVNATLNATAWDLLAVGDYVVVNRWMTVLTPHFLREREPIPPAPLSADQVGKFADDPHFALVFRDQTFSVYRVMSKPPP